MNEWRPTRWTIPFTAEDKMAFAAPLRVNAHFGLPLPMAERVFSISLNEAGLSNVHDSRKKFRPHYLGNTMAFRHIKQNHPDAWIWDERYRFSSKYRNSDKQFARAQKEFTRIMGIDRIQEIDARARNDGFEHGGMTVGRPDMAVYLPGEDAKWRFIEIKMRTTGDRLKPEQEQWLKLLADIFGEDAAVELEFIEKP